MRRAQLRIGETLLVQGAGGGVGTAAIQVGKALGARVVGVVSSDEKERVAREAGADEVVRSDGDWRAEAGPADVIFDPVGGERFDESVRALAPEGRLVVIGFTEGAIPKVGVNRLLFRNVSVVGAAWGEFALPRPEYLREVGEDLERMIESGHVRPIVGRRYAFDRRRRRPARPRRAPGRREAGAGCEVKWEVELPTSHGAAHEPFDDPVVITCSISGAIANRDQCPAIPYTPEEYAAEARRVVDEGACDDPHPRPHARRHALLRDRGLPGDHRGDPGCRRRRDRQLLDRARSASRSRSASSTCAR